MRRIAAAGLTLATLLSVAWVLVPVYLIRPFSPETPEGLSMAYALRGRAPAVTLALFAFGLVVAAILWRTPSRGWKRSILGLAVILLGASAFIGRSNHFEWIYNQIPHPEFADAASAQDVADADLVLGVRIGSESRAYPVREMAYHHLVNDIVSREPIVATY